MERRYYAPGLSALLCTMVLSACGGGASSADSAATPAATTPAATATGTASPPATVKTVSIVSLASDSESTTTAAGNVTVMVDRGGSNSGTASVQYATVDGTATQGKDYTAVNGTLSWADGETASKSIFVPVSSKGAGDKSFSVGLANASGATLGTSAVTISIKAASAPPAVQLATLQFSSGSASVPATSNAVTLSVQRTGSATGIAVVNYATADGSAIAGTDYTSTSGTLNWASGDSAAKSLTVKIAANADGKTFNVALSAPVNATLSNPSTATVSVGAAQSAGTGNAKLAVRVMGDHFVDAGNNVLQLRGVNVSALEFTAVNSCNVSDPWCGQTPNYAAIKSWDSNVIRVPLNEASWLGYTCVDGSGASRNPDPGHNYKATVQKTVSDATAAGLYVVLDLHWSAPKNYCPLAQNPMADADNSIDFWTSVASMFQSYPNVMFELFNEPYLFWLASGQVDWQVLMHGGTETQYVTGNGAAYTANYTWKVAGMQQMLDAVRATGATNVVLIAGTNWAQDLSAWVANKPKDSLNQIAAVWHAYPNSATVGDPQAALPKFGSIGYTWTGSVLTAGYPVFISEFGDHDAAGTKSSPFVSNLLPWADAHGASYTGWTWDVWQDADNVLIKDASGTPTDGYGAYTKQHYVCRGSNGNNCQ